ncbi:hypothetical protein DRO19_00580 [Candidatus Bathyarchaeota archaeon]|nr:MAG: hypothetical protein DRO19_00580 [Candidatus Bathyarchaeota archaeon]
MSYIQNNNNVKKESTYSTLRSLRRLLKDNDFQNFVGQFNDRRKVSLWLSPVLVDLFRFILRVENPANPKSVSQAIHEYMLDYVKNYILTGGKNQVKLTQFIIAQPHSQVLIQNKMEAPQPTCFIESCNNPAVTTAISLQTGKKYPVCSRHAEELKNHPKWRIL